MQLLGAAVLVQLLFSLQLSWKQTLLGRLATVTIQVTPDVLVESGTTSSPSGGHWGPGVLVLAATYSVTVTRLPNSA